MKESDLLKAIERIELEKRRIVESREYVLGKNIYNVIKLIKKISTKKIFMMIREKKDSRRYPVISNESIDYGASVKDKKVVVYTSIFGRYDLMQVPLLKPENVDFVIFTDDNTNCSGWKIAKCPKEISNFKNIFKNRYIKMNPHKLFAGKYDYAIYIDGNIRIISDVTSFINKINSKTGLALFRHERRKCVFDEIKALISLKKGNKKMLLQYASMLADEKFPVLFGLLQCSIIVTDLKNDCAQNILSEWWKLFNETCTLRDQILLPYVLWKKQLIVDDIGSLGNNVYMCNKFEVMKHSEAS